MQKKRSLILSLCCTLILINGSLHAEESLSLKDLSIPESLGKVEARFAGETDYWVVHIQDVHTHFAAQENIAAIIDHLNRHYQVETVGLEGGWSDTTFPDSWGLPSSRQKQLFARELLERDFLTGPAFAALFSKTPLQLIGIEKASVYEENRALFVEHLKVREQVLQKISQWEKSIAHMKSSTYNPDLYDFDQALMEFRRGKNSEKFIPSVVRIANANNINIFDLDQIALLRKIIEKDTDLSKDKLEAESKRLMKQFKKLGLTFEELLRNNKIPKERLEFYPATRTYIELMLLRDQLNYHIFFDQLEISIARIKENLYKSEEEKKVDEEALRAELTRTMTLLEATPKDVERFEKMRGIISEDAKRFEIVESLELANKFYNLAKERDAIFFDKLKTDSRLQKNTAVVTGGFHTEGLSKRLLEQKISHIIITPDLADQEPNKELYFRRIQQNLPTASAIQTPIETTFMNPFFDRAFFEGLRILKEERNILKALAAIERVLGGSTEFMQKTAHATLKMKEFLALSEEEQMATLNQWLNLANTSDVSIAVSGMQNNLIKDTPLSINLFRQLKENRLNSIFVGVPFEDIVHEETLTRNPKLKRVRASSVEEILSQRSVERKLQEYITNKHAAVIDGNYQSREMLVLPPEDFILLLVRPLLEGYLAMSTDADIRAQFWSRIQEMIMTLEAFEALRSAA